MTWESFKDAVGLRFDYNLFEKTADTYVRFIGEYSPDKVSWNTMGIGSPQALIDDVTLLTAGFKTKSYARVPDEFARYVRIGIQVGPTGSPLFPLRVRLSASVTILREHATATWGLVNSATINAGVNDFGSAIDATLFRVGEWVCTYTSSGGAPNPLKFSLWSSGDGTNYGKVAESAGLNAVADGVVLATESLGPYMKVKTDYTSGGGTVTGVLRFIGKN